MARVAIFAGVLSFVGGQSAWGQGSHAQDVRFSYVDGKIAADAELGVRTGNFPDSGLFQQNAGSPGFASETDLGLGIGAGDLIAYNVLDSLFYWVNGQFQELDPEVHIRIDTSVPGVPDTVIDGASGFQPGGFSPHVNTIGEANANGDFHSHVDFFLEPMQVPGEPPFWGAYGLKLSLTTNAPEIEDSNPFFFVFNFGLDSNEFSDAVDAFSALLAPGLPGDFDGDGIVDGHDFLLWQRTDGTAQGLADWQSNFGTQAPSPIAAVAVVPEPTAGSMLLVGIAVCLASRLRLSDTKHPHPERSMPIE